LGSAQESARQSSLLYLPGLPVWEQQFAQSVTGAEKSSWHWSEAAEIFARSERSQPYAQLFSSMPVVKNSRSIPRSFLFEETPEERALAALLHRARARAQKSRVLFEQTFAVLEVSTTLRGSRLCSQSNAAQYSRASDWSSTSELLNRAEERIEARRRNAQRALDLASVKLTLRQNRAAAQREAVSLRHDSFFQTTYDNARRHDV
jgi:hypothetical protein